MPRPLRLNHPNACYHVMNRGAGFRSVFSNSIQRQMFLQILGEAVSQFNIKIHAFCLMSNHYHLLICTPKANLSQAMRYINGVYTLRHNRLKKTDGPLFRGRYKAILVEKDSYLLQLSRYIHLNPVTASLVKNPADYPWSSYQYYIKKTRPLSWLTTKDILASMGKRNQQWQYREFVESGDEDNNSEFAEQNSQSVILGTKEFKDKHLSSLVADQISNSQSDFNKSIELPTLEKILKHASTCLNSSEIDITKYHRGKTNHSKMLAIHACRKLGKARLKDIARLFSFRSHGGISKTVTAAEKLLADDKKLKDSYQKLMKSLGLQNDE
jgi:putative transposase